MKAKARKKIVYNNAIKLYNKLISNYLNDYDTTTDEEKEKMVKKYNPNNLFIKGYRYIESKKEDEEKSKWPPEETIAERLKLRIQNADDKDLSVTPSLEDDESYDDSDEFVDTPDMPPLEDDETVNERKRLKILARNKF